MLLVSEPTNVVMGNTKLISLFWLQLPGWHECLGMVLDETATLAA
jgi:hypothetical protein